MSNRAPRPREAFSLAGRFGSVAFALLALSVGATSACHVEANVKTSGEGEDPVVDRNEHEPVTAAAAAPVSEPPRVPTSPPASACPLFCHEARGAVRAELTAEELTSLRSGLEPVLGRMRSCSSPEGWRRYGSPVVNLRIGPDGALAELGVDPYGGRDAACYDDAEKIGSGVQVSLPGRKVVRCTERCVNRSANPEVRHGGSRRRR
jgi:hypothetical protein